MMREYFTEGDIVCAEVQSVFADGALSLHTRSAKFGKVREGVLVDVPVGLVKRCKNHIHTLPCGITVVLGVNGYVFVSPVPTEQSDGDEALPPVSLETRTALARVSNAVRALAHCCVPITDSSVVETYDASARYSPADMLDRGVMEEIAQAAIQHARF